MSYAVVTGAGRGIGEATVHAFAARGIDVALLGHHRDPLLTVAQAARRKGVKAEVFQCDVRSSKDVHASAHASLGAWGAPACVVNNAGVIRRAAVHELSEEDWECTLDTNLKGVFLVTRAFLASMLAVKRGRIVTVSSISATLGTPGSSAYCASKWGVVGFMKSLAEELRHTGLQAISVLPGSVDTAMLDGSGFSPQMTPNDVAKLIVYAALDAPDAMNGSAVELFGP